MKVSGVWLLFFLIFFLILSFFNGIERAAFLSLIIILPLVPPVHLNNYFIDRYFLKRKYWYYFSLLFASLILFGFVAQSLMNKFHNVEGEYIGAMLNPFVAVLFTSGMKSFRENLQNKYMVAEARARQAEVELDLLKSQVNPHFLFNALNSIYSLSLKNSKNTSNAVILLSNLMRYHLETSKRTKVPLSEEVDFISSYIDLEKLRFGKKCKIEFQVEGMKDTHHIPPFLMTPLVENCFKHGISTEKKRNEISISLQIEGDQLAFKTKNYVSGNSIGYPDDKKVKTGLVNIDSRLKLLYGSQYEFGTEERAGIFYTTLIIEL